MLTFIPPELLLPIIQLLPPSDVYKKVSKLSKRIRAVLLAIPVPLRVNLEWESLDYPHRQLSFHDEWDYEYKKDGSLQLIAAHMYCNVHLWYW